MRYRFAVVTALTCCLVVGMSRALVADPPPVPRIELVIPRSEQPHERAHEAGSSVIWFDDFDEDAFQERYPEKSGETTADVRMGESGKSLLMRYEKGSQGEGNRKVFFGDTPTYQAKAARRGEKFDEVYWRIYVKHEAGWTGGGPAKLSRATSIVPPGWRQAMIAHVWSSGESLTLDPATGVRDGEVVTRRYNDFDRLRWLGNRPASKLAIHSREESGWWICVESRAKLNSPGKKDGINQLWIDGKLEAERRDLDWRGTFDERGINAVFLEAYWNEGSPIDQSRWIDHFVISTKPIGPLVCPRNPIVVKTKLADDLLRVRLDGTSGERAEGGDAPKPSLQAWELEIAQVGEPGQGERRSEKRGEAAVGSPADIGDGSPTNAGHGEADAGSAERETVVWRSQRLGPEERVVVDTTNGEFVGPLRGVDRLAPNETFRCRARQQSSDGAWSDWSRWHQTFRTGE